MKEEEVRVPGFTMNEQSQGWTLTVYLPGMGKEDVELHVQGRSLTLKTHAKYQNPAGFKQVAAEFTRSNYGMSVDLPETADPATVHAKQENGLLTVTVQRRPETQGRVITIG